MKLLHSRKETNLLIISHLMEEMKPHHKVYFVDLSWIQREIPDFLSRGFDSSVQVERLNESEFEFSAPNLCFFQLSFKPFLQIHIGSNVLFLPVMDVNRARVTCGGLKTKISFYYYRRPFSAHTWLAIVTSSMLTSSLFCIVPPPYRRFKDILPSLLW